MNIENVKNLDDTAKILKAFYQYERDKHNGDVEYDLFVDKYYPITFNCDWEDDTNGSRYPSLTYNFLDLRGDNPTNHFVHSVFVREDKPEYAVVLFTHETPNEENYVIAIKVDFTTGHLYEVSIMSYESQSNIPKTHTVQTILMGFSDHSQELIKKEILKWLDKLSDMQDSDFSSLEYETEETLEHIVNDILELINSLEELRHVVKLGIASFVNTRLNLIYQYKSFTLPKIIKYNNILASLIAQDMKKYDTTHHPEFNISDDEDY